MSAEGTIQWHLSAAVMPVPPYGSRDVAGSDTASRLIAGTTTVTGKMKGLKPNTTHTVYVSKSYKRDTTWPGLLSSALKPFNFVTDAEGAGSWTADLTEAGVQSGSSQTLSVWINEGGRTILVSDNFEPVTVAWHVSADVMPVPPYGSRDVAGSDTASKLAVDGARLSGAMSGLKPNTAHKVYVSKPYAPQTTWPGLLTSKLPAFTFKTDAAGSGSWSVDLNAAGLPSGTSQTLSVWINEGGLTILVSDTFPVALDG